jgi:SAM-dependent methyltransferase
MLTETAVGARCPVCEGAMRAAGRVYTLDELFELWHPVAFSRETIDAHREQGAATRAFRCTRCELETFVPAIVGTSRFYVEAYNLERTQKDSTFTYSDDKWEFGEALRDCAGHERVFEFGCGAGRFLERLTAAGHDARGSEYNSAALAQARARGLHVLGPEDSMTALAGTCDAAFSFHVLEHTADPLGFVRRMVAVVKPGGVIGISVPNQDGPIAYIDPCIMNMPPHHVTRWRLRSFEALAARLGLAIERVAYEPLLLENHSYYSVHWVGRVLPGSTRFGAALRFGASGLLRAFFGTLRRLGLRYFTPLRGQSIYVLMRAPRRSAA